MTLALSDNSTQSRRRRKAGSLKRADRRFAYVILIPAMTAFIVMVAYPFIDAMSMAFYQYTIYDPVPTFIGFENFATILTDPYVLGSWVTTAIFVVGTILLTMFLGLTWPC